MKILCLTGATKRDWFARRNLVQHLREQHEVRVAFQIAEADKAPASWDEGFLVRPSQDPLDSFDCILVLTTELQPDIDWAAYVEGGGILVHEALLKDVRPSPECQEQLRNLFGVQVIEEQGQVVYLADHAGVRVTFQRSEMWGVDGRDVDWWGGAEHVLCEWPVPLQLLRGRPIATVTEQCRPLVSDRLVLGLDVTGYPWANAVRLGNGLSILLAGGVTADLLVDHCPDNVYFLRSIIEGGGDLLLRDQEIFGPVAPGGRKELSVDLADLFSGESEAVEYKSTMLADLRKGGVRNPEMSYEVITTVAGFLNSDHGGHLLLGVNDHGEVLGLKPDFKLMAKAERTPDKYILRLLQVLKDLSPEQAGLIKPEVHTIEGEIVCVVAVKPASVPVYAPDGAGDSKSSFQDAFYVRHGPSTKRLRGVEADVYKKRRFG